MEVAVSARADKGAGQAAPKIRQNPGKPRKDAGGAAMKKTKKNNSILHDKDGTCYLCARLNSDYSQKRCLHEHHIYGGPNRRVSEAEGLKAYLCPEHHTAGSEAVHNNNKNMRILQQDAQRAYEAAHTREEFMKIIGRNYLEN